MRGRRIDQDDRNEGFRGPLGAYHWTSRSLFWAIDDEANRRCSHHAVEPMLFLVLFFDLAFCPCVSELLLQRQDLRLQGGILQDKIPDLRSDELPWALLRLLRF